MILFLDFDGTTHPVGARLDQEFCCLPRLENVLREYPQIRVVISSWWRFEQDLETLQSYFSEDIRPRVFDKTPFVDGVEEKTGFILATSRHDEILGWINANNYAGPWVALDDATEQFPKDSMQLIPCKSWLGFDEDVERVLRKYLRKFV